MNFMERWNQIRERISQIREMSPETLMSLIESLLIFALSVLVPVKTTNGNPKLSKFFLMIAISKLTVLIATTTYVSKLYPELTVVILTNNAAVFREFHYYILFLHDLGDIVKIIICCIVTILRYFGYVMILGWFYTHLELLLKRIISERKSMMEDSKVWQLTAQYNKNELVLICVTVLGASLMASFMMLSIFVIQTNAYRLPVNFYILPLPVQESSINWIINYFYQVSFTFFAVAIFCCYFPTVMLMVNHACWKVDALIINVEEINQTSNNREDMEIIENQLRVDELLDKTVDSCCNAIDWINKVQEIMKFHFLIEFSLLSFVLCMTLYAIAFGGSISYELFPMFIVPISQLFIYCWMGSRLIIRIEKLSVVVYDVKWYNMSCKQQKKIQMVLIIAQTMKGFNGIFNEVNMETFKKILHFTYSLFTLMRSIN